MRPAGKRLHIEQLGDSVMTILNKLPPVGGIVQVIETKVIEEFK